MTLLSVKSYVATQAAQIPLSGISIWSAVHAYRQRPKREKAGHTCIAAIGDVRRIEDRATMPRGAAEKLLTYDLDLLLYATHSDEQSGGDAFDTLVENAAAFFRTLTPGNPALIDAVTGATSYLTHIGEREEVELLLPEETGGSQSRMNFRAILRLAIVEIVSPA